MARLEITSHPGRTFKDEPWDHGDYKAGHGYRSIGDMSDGDVRYGSLWAFAVPFEVESDSAERGLFNDICNLHPPFVAAEIVKQRDGTLVAIGFYSPSE